jgi:hypothetical protein
MKRSDAFHQYQNRGRACRNAGNCLAVCAPSVSSAWEAVEENNLDSLLPHEYLIRSDVNAATEIFGSKYEREKTCDRFARTLRGVGVKGGGGKSILSILPPVARIGRAVCHKNMGISVSTMLAPPKEAPDGRNADLGSGHQEKIEVKTPTKAPKRQRTISSDELTLDGLPEEVLYRIVHILNARDNYALASTCFRLQTIVEVRNPCHKTLESSTSVTFLLLIVPESTLTLVRTCRLAVTVGKPSSSRRLGK